MPSTTPSLEMAHVLFMDIVAYSTLPMDHQQERLANLQEAVRNTAEFARAQAEDQLIRLPTGDGMALVFFQDPEAPVRCALELTRNLRDCPKVKLRIGIHTGPVYRVADINTNRNVAGGGINIAQRVMDCGDAGHILVSSAQAEVLGQVSAWCPLLHDLGEIEVKHGLRLHIYNLYDGEIGNSGPPKKLAVITVPPLIEHGGAAAGSLESRSGLEEWLKNPAKRTVLLRWLFIAGPVAAALLWTLSFFWPLLLRSGESRLRAQQPVWAGEINDAFSRSQVQHSGFRAHLHDPRESPDLLTTAQALTALLAQPNAGEYQANIDEAFDYIESQRRTTPYPGWIYAESSTVAMMPTTEVSAWVAVAKAHALKSMLPRSDKAVQIARLTIRRDLDLLAAQQNPDGSWSPLSVMQQARGTSRTYTSALSLWALVEAKHTGDSEVDAQTNSAAFDAVIEKSADWLLSKHGSRCGWVPNPSRSPQGNDCYLGLTAQILFILSIVERDLPSLKNHPAYVQAERGFVDRLEAFADVHQRSKTVDDDGVVGWMEGSYQKLVPIQGWSFFAYPWTLAELRHLSASASLDAVTRLRAKTKLYRLLSYFPESEPTSELCCTFEIAEDLYCARFSVGPPASAQ